MSTNCDLKLQESIDRLVYMMRKKFLRSDDYEILSLYSGDEEAAIEGLRAYADRKREYFDRRNRVMMPRCEFSMIDGHGVVDIIHVWDDSSARIQKEKFVMNRRPRRRYQ